MSKNLSELSSRKGVIDNLFDKIGDEAAKNNGTVSNHAINELASEYLMGKANIFGSASFYDFTRTNNKDKKIYVCNGSACKTAKTQHHVKEKLLHYFKDEEIGDMCCLGRCYENSAFAYNHHNYSGTDIQDFNPNLNEPFSALPTHSYHVSALGTPILTQDIPEPKIYYALLHSALKTPPTELLEEVKKSNLKGRGGAGFPTYIKMEGCMKTPDDTKFIVCNADEGDPGAYSDRFLLEQKPDSVLLGMILSGYIVGANWGVLYIRAEYPESIRIVEDRLLALYELGYLGSDILGSGFNFDIKVIKAQGAYICGEESALLNSIEGQRPEVRTRPPYPAQQGLFNKPTAINNVETLACLPYIIKNGGDQFAKLGTSKTTGTKLICLDGFFNKPGLIEVEMGTPLSTVVNELGQGFKVPVKALHIGGPLGGIVPIHKIDELTIDFENFSSHGFLLGHASVVCIPEDYPLINYLEHLFEFTAHESCGKCFPCRIGSVRGKELLKRARQGSDKIDGALFSDLLDTLQFGSLCALGGGLPLPIRNSLKYFDEELKQYFE
ncbi:MAG: NAD(P)H-dependent oxidoreductase subunit E [Saprospiraceae bacterium]|nr:NAD(P)H-dependent oxidoreductase subunit E [Saprospiraceae bacterium]